MASSAENQVTAVTNHLCPHYPFCIPGHGRQLCKLQKISCRRFGVPLTPERILGRLVGLWSIRRHVAAPPQRHTTSQETTWHPPLPGVSRFRHFRCYLGRPHALQGPPRHPPLPGMSLFRRFRCYLGRPHAPHGPLRHPSLPGMSLFRRIGSHLRRVTMYPALWQRAPAPDAPLKRGISFAKIRGFSC